MVYFSWQLTSGWWNVWLAAEVISFTLTGACPKLQGTGYPVKETNMRIVYPIMHRDLKTIPYLASYHIGKIGECPQPPPPPDEVKRRFSLFSTDLHPLGDQNPPDYAGTPSKFVWENQKPDFKDLIQTKFWPDQALPQIYAVLRDTKQTCIAMLARFWRHYYSPHCSVRKFRCWTNYIIILHSRSICGPGNECHLARTDWEPSRTFHEELHEVFLFLVSPCRIPGRTSRNTNANRRVSARGFSAGERTARDYHS